jgi:hypothetical protein
LSPVAWQQRIVAEAAVRMLSGSTKPLVVDLPDDVNARYFAGLPGISWLHRVTLGQLNSSPAKVGLRRVTADASAAGVATNQPSASADPETATGDGDETLDEATIQAARTLVTRGRQLASVLPYNGIVGDEVTDEALSTISYAQRIDPTPDMAAAAASGTIARTLGEITIDPPESVTLASGSGRFATTIVNDLPQEVTVGIKPRSDSGITFDVPDSITIPGNSTATVLLTAHASQVGRHNVDLELTGANGTLIGSNAEVPVRAAQVGAIIWAFIGTGVGLLFVAIGIRLFRRIRASRRAARVDAQPDGSVTSSDLPVS